MGCTIKAPSIFASSMHCNNDDTVAQFCNVDGGSCTYGYRLDTESSSVPQTCKCESITFGLMLDEIAIEEDVGVDVDDIMAAATVFFTNAVLVDDDEL